MAKTRTTKAERALTAELDKARLTERQAENKADNAARELAVAHARVTTLQDAIDAVRTSAPVRKTSKPAKESVSA